MSVKTIYIVQRGEKEVMRTEEKKHADWYDKRLDNATILQDILSENKELVKGVKEDKIEDICIYLSMNMDKISKVFKGKSFEDALKECGADEYTKK
jgi:dsDNA-binding SOS-regulon protein